MDTIRIKDRQKEEIDDWKPSKEGWIKVNCDGACDSKEKIAVVGVIARDSNKRMLLGLGMEIKTEVAKAMAIKHGVKLAIEKRYQKVWIESDYKNIIEELNSKKRRCSWKVGTIVNSIKESRKGRSEMKFGFVKHNANDDAHRIAQ